VISWFLNLLLIKFSTCTAYAPAAARHDRGVAVLSAMVGLYKLNLVDP
jgi:hypothetical protein